MDDTEIFNRMRSSPLPAEALHRPEEQRERGAAPSPPSPVEWTRWDEARHEAEMVGTGG